MNTSNSLVKDTVLHVLLDELDQPARLELPPVDPNLVNALRPFLKQGFGVLPFARDFRFVLSRIGPSILDLSFVHEPTRSQFRLAVALHPAAESIEWWYVMTREMGLGKTTSYGAAPTSFVWAAVALPGRSMEACLADGEDLFFELPAIASALLHWAIQQN